MPAMAGPASYPPQQQGHPQGPVSSHPPAALAAQGGQAHAQTNGAWAPVAPTIRGLAPAGTATPSAVTPTPPDYDGVHRPTLNDPGYPVSGAQGPHAPQQAQQAQWAATAHQGAPTPSPAPALASYRVDAGAAALPLPPAGSRPGVSQPPPAGAAPPGFGALTPTPPPGGYTPAPGGYTPAPYGQPLSTPPLPVSRGGIVFVILGLSGVIAVLILVVVWALWLRG
jgi:hypothetical protein